MRGGGCGEGRGMCARVGSGGREWAGGLLTLLVKGWRKRKRERRRKTDRAVVAPRRQFYGWR